MLNPSLNLSLHFLSADGCVLTADGYLLSTNDYLYEVYNVRNPSGARLVASMTMLISRCSFHAGDVWC